MSTTAFAGTFDPPNQVDKGVTGDTTTSPSKDWPITVHGYIGPDTTLTDTDPTDPTVKPDPTDPDMMINVAVPMKILWAAFGTDNGKVTSPNYYVKNLSLSNDVEVTVTGFAPVVADSFDAPTEAALKDALDLSIISSAGSYTTTPSAIPLIFGAAADRTLSRSYLTSASDPVTLDKLDGADLGSAATWNFNIGGHYYDNITSTTIMPEYNLTFKFTAVV